MTISLDYIGTYTEYKPFFDEMALALQSRGHRVGIICDERDKHADAMNRHVIDERANITNALGFTPDFMYLYGETETISNGYLWKAERMDQEDVLVHFDDDAAQIKRYTGRWCFKALNSAQIGKF